LKLIDSYLLILRSTQTGIPNNLPNGGTAPGRQPVVVYTSSGVANLMFLQFIIFLNYLEENFLDALKIAR